MNQGAEGCTDLIVFARPELLEQRLEFAAQERLDPRRAYRHGTIRISDWSVIGQGGQPPPRRGVSAAEPGSRQPSEFGRRCLALVVAHLPVTDRGTQFSDQPRQMHAARNAGE